MHAKSASDRSGAFCMKENEVSSYAEKRIRKEA
nr:MAG TPA: hypothetical protein [Caudoviricetes sp.]